jgi:HEAT repeat protein
MTGYVPKKMLGAARLPDTPSARAYLDRALDDDDTHKSRQRDYWLEHFAALVEAAVTEKHITAIQNIERKGGWITREDAIEAIRGTT